MSNARQQGAKSPLKDNSQIVSVITKPRIWKMLTKRPQNVQ